MVESWRFWFIMPENGDTRKPSLGVQPMGTGPFQYKNFVKGDRLELTKFADYWQDGQPFLDNLTFKFLADEAAAGGELPLGRRSVPARHLGRDAAAGRGQEQLEADPIGPVLRVVAAARWYFGPLADVRVRRALQFAFDRKTDNKVAWGGRADDTWNPFDKSPYYIGKKWPVSFDPERAKSDLAKAGQPNLKLNMMILSDPGPWHREADVLQQGFKKSGINATIQPLPAAQWFDRLYTKRNHEGIAVNAGSLPFPWALIANYMMKATLLKNPPKYPKGAIPPLEAAYNLAFSSANEAQYATALKTIQRLMLSEAAVFHTMIAANQNIAPQNLQGVDSTVFGDQRFNGAYLA